METLSFDDIVRAAGVLKGIAHLTPIVTSYRLDDVSGATVFLK